MYLWVFCVYFCVELYQCCLSVEFGCCGIGGIEVQCIVVVLLFVMVVQYDFCDCCECEKSCGDFQGEYGRYGLSVWGFVVCWS